VDGNQLAPAHNAAGANRLVALVPMMIRGYWFLVKTSIEGIIRHLLIHCGLIFAYALYQSNTGPHTGTGHNCTGSSLFS